MQTCMRPSFESRTGKLCGTIAVPTPDVTTSCGNPPPVGTNQVTFSTGAQSLPEQHSLGYQECAAAGADDRTIAAINQRIVQIAAFTDSLAKWDTETATITACVTRDFQEDFVYC